MIDYRSLENVEFDHIVSCMKEAFSDYVVPLNFDRDYLYQRFTGQNVRFDLSYGAFVEGQLVGILLNAIGNYNNELVAYDACTGIVPDYRGQGVFKELMAFTYECLAKEGIKKYVLEVVQDNTRAVETYKKQGMILAKAFACFKGKSNEALDSSFTYEQRPMSKEIYPIFASVLNYEPCFENRIDVIETYIKDYEVIYVSQDKDIKAFVIYNKESGEIKILDYKEDISLLKQLVLVVSNQFDSLRIVNIPFKREDLIDMLEQLGFDHFADQYEMAKDL